MQMTIMLDTRFDRDKALMWGLLKGDELRRVVEEFYSSLKHTEISAQEAREVLGTMLYEAGLNLYGDDLNV